MILNKILWSMRALHRLISQTPNSNIQLICTMWWCRDDFRDFVGVCFKEFGDRVKHWITINEPYVFIEGGYDGGAVGILAPGRCSDRAKCAQGNSATEPYIAGHNLLLCHAAAVKLYREKFKVNIPILFKYIIYFSEKIILYLIKNG